MKENGLDCGLATINIKSHSCTRYHLPTNLMYHVYSTIICLRLAFGACFFVLHDIYTILVSITTIHFCFIGLQKKLLALSKRRVAFGYFSEWIRSIVNHVHWVVKTSEGEERMAKWNSLLNHLTNVHNHDDPLYPQCAHTELNRKWVDKGM